MLTSAITLLILSVVVPAFMAPTRKPDVPLASDLLVELKKFQSQLRPLQNEFKKIFEAVKKETHEKSEEEHHEDTGKHKEEKYKEEDDFISRVAEKVSSKLSIEDSPEKIQRLVNLTSYRLVTKMNASKDNVQEFKLKLLGLVLKILNERALKYEPPVNKSLPAAPKGVDERKVIQALEELLEGPLISGFVSQGQERHMIKSAIKALSKDFGLSKTTTEDMTEMMIHHVEEDVKSLSESKGKHGTTQPMTDEEKILGLEKTVQDKVNENNLNLDEMKYLVQGLAAAVGARNNLSQEQTKRLEEEIRKGVYDSFANNNLPKNEESELSQLINNKQVPEGFRAALQEKNEDKDKRSFEVEKENEDRNLSSLLEDLEKKWDEEKKSSVEAKKQKQYLKEILSNSLALMESLEAEQKQRNNESQHTSQKDEKEHRKEIETEEKGFRKEIQAEEKEHRHKILEDEKEHRQGKQTEKEHRKAIEKEEKEHRIEVQSELKDHRQEIEKEEKEYAENKTRSESEKPTPEATKQVTNNPTNQPKENGHTTEKQNVRSQTSTQPMEKNGTSEPMEKVVTSQDQEQPIEKRDGIPDDLAKEIEDAEAEIQREIEIQERKEEKMMIEKEEERKEKEKAKEKAKEKKEFIPKSKVSNDQMNEAEKELEKELQEQEKERKQKEKLKEINIAEKEIEKEIEEQEKSLKSKMTTAKPATAKTDSTENNNELIKQLDDLFQDS